jgi:hypothetical protein
VIDTQSTTAAVDHPHVGSIPFEPNQLIGTFAKASVVIAADPHVRFEPREAARSAGKALWNGIHIKSRPSTLPGG